MLDLVFCNLKDSYVTNWARGIGNSDFKMVKISSKFHPINQRKVTPKNRTVVKTDYAKLCRLMEKQFEQFIDGEDTKNAYGKFY